jgi:hypothetical protein
MKSVAIGCHELTEWRLPDLVCAAILARGSLALATRVTPGPAGAFSVTSACGAEPAARLRGGVGRRVGLPGDRTRSPSTQKSAGTGASPPHVDPRGWRPAGPPRPPRRRLPRDKCLWRRGRVGLPGDRARSSSTRVSAGMTARLTCVDHAGAPGPPPREMLRRGRTVAVLVTSACGPGPRPRLRTPARGGVVKKGEFSFHAARSGGGAPTSVRAGTFVRPTSSSANRSLAITAVERTNGYASQSPRPRLRLFSM